MLFRSDWTAESGTYYYETETYRDNNGGTQTRQVQRTRWQPASGALEQFFDDELEPSTRGVHAELLRKVEPFATKDLVPYDAGYLSGWTVEQYQIDLITAAKQARVSMDDKLRQLCGAAVPGDTFRNLAVQARNVSPGTAAPQSWRSLSSIETRACLAAVIRSI